MFYGATSVEQYMQTHVSLIIPVHNAEPFLERCLDSAAAQTGLNVEIICVDDASTDASPDILDARACEDKRFHVVHRPTNGGEAVARNQGVALAHGEYLLFLDHDDMLMPDACRVLYQAAKTKNADIAKGRAKTIDFDGKISVTPLILQAGIKKSRFLFLDEWWTAIYKKEIIHGNIIFAEGYPLGTDVLFLVDVLLETSKIICVNDIVYTHILREGSGYSKYLSYEKICSDAKICLMAIDRLNDSHLYVTEPHEYVNAAIRFLSNGIVHFFRAIDEKSKKCCCDLVHVYKSKVLNIDMVLDKIHIFYPNILQVLSIDDSEELYEILQKFSSIEEFQNNKVDRLSPLRNSVRQKLTNKGS